MGNWEPPIIIDSSSTTSYNSATNKHSDHSNGGVNILHDGRELNANQISSYRNRHHGQDNRDNENVSDHRGWRVLRKEYCWDRCPPDEKCPWFFHDKPLTWLLIVLGFNWVLNIIFSNIFLELEGPPQKV